MVRAPSSPLLQPIGAAGLSGARENSLASRYHGLDALRAFMMLLGVLLHVSLPYTGVNLRGNYVTPERSKLLQVVLISHYFRMPIFFLLSGFFSARILETRGTVGFLRIRTVRVGLVWIASLFVLSPVLAVIGVYNHFASEGGPAFLSSWNAIAIHAIDGNWLQQPPLHLWFLEYLLVFCFAAIAVLACIRSFLPAIDRYTGAIIGSRFRVPILAIPTAVTLLFMPLAIVPYPNSFVPWAGVSFAYGWFYAIGWFVYRRRDRLPELARGTRAEKLAVPILMMLNVILTRWRLKLGSDANEPLLDPVLALVTALFMWSTIVILIGAFHRIRAGRWLRHLSDASYWIYLAHYPLAVLMPASLRDWPVSPVVKVAFATVLISAVQVWIYERFIRHTAAGRLLHGMRAPTRSNVEILRYN